ncbi:hypothetical protein K7711_28930 [Nocardia sp. CA2R105]|uniref:hypothetical protein n=1 Tax=Nocardia coffeae TaxID=2873381 RepID=UPI001CA7135D|nr:hypothetical protein [Nocardia coffeae]MBY8860526.1 hypothetical protein [Nocardia coffeae]
MVLLLILLALLVLVGGVAAIVMTIARHQKQSIAYDNQIVPGMPSNAPSSWAGSHDPEARLHRRLRDAIRALHGVNAYDTASSVNLRAGLEQSALAVDNHLIAIATLPQSHRDQALPDATAAVEAVEAGVAQYVSATTKPDPVALEAGLQGVQTSIDAITQNLGALGPGGSTGGYPVQFGIQSPQAMPQQSGAAFPTPPASGSYPQPQTGGGYPQPGTPSPGGYPSQPGTQPPAGYTPQPGAQSPGGYAPQSGAQSPGGYAPQSGAQSPGGYAPQLGAQSPGGNSPQPGAQLPGGYSPQAGTELPGGYSQPPGGTHSQAPSPQQQPGGANPEASAPQQQSGTSNPPDTGTDPADPTVIRRQP